MPQQNDELSSKTEVIVNKQPGYGHRLLRPKRTETARTVGQLQHWDKSYLNFYLKNNNTLYCGANHGFFSNCTVTLQSLIELHNKNLTLSKIDFSSAFCDYKTPEQNQRNIDLYPYYFKTDLIKEITKKDKKILKQDHHGHYKHYDFYHLNPFIQRYFSLNQDILNIQNMLIEKYKIDLSKTIAVWYRGTDKYLEVQLAEPSLYLNLAEELLGLIPDVKILIQTDQKQVRDLFINHFKDRCFFFEEMPVTDSKMISYRDSKLFNPNRFEFGKLLLAVTHLFSKCQIIVNHTGNVASWICLFRGNADSVFQFNQQGKLVVPDKWANRLSGEQLLHLVAKDEVFHSNPLDTPVVRFQNSTNLGTYLYATEVEAENIRINFSNFIEEGVAFNAAITPDENLIPLYRFQSNQRPGTYLYVGEEERNKINADSNLANVFNEEGIAFYVYGAGAGIERPFYRFQNSTIPGTYLYATEVEAENIRANFPHFIEEGVAFEAANDNSIVQTF